MTARPPSLNPQTADGLPVHHSALKLNSNCPLYVVCHVFGGYLSTPPEKITQVTLSSLPVRILSGFA